MPILGGRPDDAPDIPRASSSGAGAKRILRFARWLVMGALVLVPMLAVAAEAAVLTLSYDQRLTDELAILLAVSVRAERLTALP